MKSNITLYCIAICRCLMFMAVWRTCHSYWTIFILWCSFIVFTLFYRFICLLVTVVFICVFQSSGYLFLINLSWVELSRYVNACVYVYLCRVMICQVLHNSDAITASDYEWGTCWTCRYWQDWNYQGPWTCTWRHGLRVQLFRADGLPRKIVFVLFIANKHASAFQRGSSCLFIHCLSTHALT